MMFSSYTSSLFIKSNTKEAGKFQLKRKWDENCDNLRWNLWGKMFKRFRPWQCKTRPSVRWNLFYILWKQPVSSGVTETLGAPRNLVRWGPYVGTSFWSGPLVLALRWPKLTRVKRAIHYTRSWSFRCIRGWVLKDQSTQQDWPSSYRCLA